MTFLVVSAWIGHTDASRDMAQDLHAATPDSVARAKIRQLADRLEAGADLETGRMERTIEDAQRAHHQLPSEPARRLVSVCGWCKDAPEQTAAARAHGFDVTHGICEACRVAFEAGAKP